jgi:agmatine deiminase
VIVAGGSTITVGVSNGPGNVSDWVMMVPAGSPAQTWGDYKYLSGSRTRPATGMTSATITFTAPPAGGTFEFRFYQNDGWTLLGSSSAVSVTP